MKILFIDDEVEIVENLIECFEKSGVGCFGAVNFNDAINQLKEVKFDVIVSDYNIETHRCASDVIEFVKVNEEKLGSPKIVVYSGQPADFLKKVLVSCGYSNATYVCKPELGLLSQKIEIDAA